MALFLSREVCRDCFLLSLPSLRDYDGIASISFTLPQKPVTEWKFMGFAHTRNMDYGQITAKAKAVKSFMVQPNMPRFIRVNDKPAISTGIMNLQEKHSGTPAWNSSIRRQIR